MSKKQKILQDLILGIVCLILTICICVQIKTVNSNGSVVNLSEEEAELKDQVLKMQEKYETSYQKLEEAENELEKQRESVTNNNEELKKLEEEIKKGNLLLGYTDVKGTGVTITVTDAEKRIEGIDDSDLILHDKDILQIINELKNAGAEAIDINGQRVVSTTAITCAGNVNTVNGEKISPVITINAIGLPEQLATLNRIGGPLGDDGYLTILSSYHIKTSFKKLDTVSIPKYTGVIKFEYAKTVS